VTRRKLGGNWGKKAKAHQLFSKSGKQPNLNHIGKKKRKLQRLRIEPSRNLRGDAHDLVVVGEGEKVQGKKGQLRMIKACIAGGLKGGGKELEGTGLVI